MEYPEGYSTAIRCVVRKVAAVKGGLVGSGGGFTVGMLFPDRWTCIWQNYSRKLRIGADIRRKEKVEKVIEFAKKMKKLQKKARAVLKKA